MAVTTSTQVELQPPGLTAVNSNDILLEFSIGDEERRALIKERAGASLHVPGLHLSTAHHRRGPSPDARAEFRETLLDGLRQRWQDPLTEAQFLKLARDLDRNGASLYSGLIGMVSFRTLIENYTKAQGGTGNKTFLHSYVNFADHPDFLTDARYNDAFAHPLLVALISYQMGGALRLNDVRGKDTDPISVNAQDNMLHIDNTPFRDEYKILLCWKRNEPVGPSGQNFTFLPGTHKGNRDILVGQDGQPWSTERDSLFVTDAAIDGILSFQQEAVGRPSMVVEVQVPDAPVSVAFAAGALVHQRYRTEAGDPRSCVICSFHVANDNPGSLITSRPSEYQPKSLVDLLMSPQNKHTASQFLSMLLDEATKIENKIKDLHISDHASRLIDINSLALTEDALARWRQSVVFAPTASTIKFTRNIYLSSAQPRTQEDFIKTLAIAMAYDKHGLLQLILYEDGREEIRKISRKKIGEMRQKTLVQHLHDWSYVFSKQKFDSSDLPLPSELRDMSDVIGDLAKARLHEVETSKDEKLAQADLVMLTSLCRLIYDMGEAIMRCEKMETFVSTSLFMFWTTSYVVPYLRGERKRWARSIASNFLRNYISSVLILERM
ncbi:hypothetical protein EYB26_007461 [Talaromyces marneffei]|uniref:Uncharacterized protein n=1 Tax=Talaromyces marneffei (strain ATCC 18224 / CBS 334.59 / QM 7333) TaxID=441960 RepID=B6QJD6_TALMQ|nr:uncharacterized protein EYB26_007461 [Talaromyces marneffei]EEA22451.1 conserved hypothetical protein [Talaromyces marneffei ATCC 18224]QGA19767.1 hypothetical protein EYB26_007461 [Talaromyces marneffei]